MRASELRRRVSIQVRSFAKNSTGQQVISWSALLTGVPADIQSLTGREMIAAQATNTEVTHLICVRYHALLSDPVAVAAMRVIYGARIFEISGAINVDERNREIQLMAAEGLTQG